MRWICLSLVALGVWPSALPAADWNQWRGPNRDGVAAASPALIDTLPSEGLEASWMTEKPIAGGGNGGWSSPVIADRRVYLFVHSRTPRPGVQLPPEKYPPLSEEERTQRSPEEIQTYDAHRRDEQRERRDQQFQYVETLSCFELASGRLLWESERPSVATDFCQSGTPAVVNGRVYVLGADRHLLCFSAKDGKELWSTRLPVDQNERQIPSSVALAEGVVAVLAGVLVGVDAERGDVLWAGDQERMQGTDSSPTVWKENGRAFFIANVNGNQTVCVEPQTGNELWRVETHANRSTPVIVGSRMITLGDSRKGGVRCFELSAEGAEEVWKFQGISDPGSSPVVVDGKVFVQGEHRLACLDLATGKPDWRGELDIAQPRYTSLIAADSKLFYIFDGVLVFSAQPRECSVLIDAKIDGAGRLVPAEAYRESLGLEEIKVTRGQEEAERVWQKETSRNAPLN